jgi:hypothetical protein
VINHAIYLKNCTATKGLDGKTPYKVFMGLNKICVAFQSLAVSYGFMIQVEADLMDEW